ncbi:MAG: PorT family protein [Bacteroidales bacterium]|nr:PorT family protein [Bacteroidales bacterium]
MRRFIFLVVFCIPTAFYAQDFKSVIENSTFGVRGGLSLADYIANPSHKVVPRIMPFAGGYAEYEVKEGFIFRPELLLMFTGGIQHTFLPNTSNPEYLADEKLTYIYMPLLVKYNFMGIDLMAGPQFGFRLSANYVNTIVDNGEITYESSADISEYRRFIDFGLALGAVYPLTEQINAELRYSYGLSTINNVTTTVKLHTSIIQAGISFKIK